MNEPVVVCPLRCEDDAASSGREVRWEREPVAHLEGNPNALADAKQKLPEGLASDEAMLVLIRRDGTTVCVGDPVVVPRRAYLDYMRNWGRNSVRLTRARSDLLPELRLGTWAEPRGPRPLRLLAVLSPSVLTDRLRPPTRAGDAAFWQGARSEATQAEWRRLTTTYSILVYHRLAGEQRRGQERIDMPPAVFHRHLRALRATRQTTETERLIGFHRAQESRVGRRVTVLTIDDVTHDVVTPVAASAELRPQLFVVTSAVGGAAMWLDGVPLARWDDLTRLIEEGVVVGSHSRTHPDDLRILSDLELSAEVTGSRRDVTRGAGRVPALFAYPNGRYDRRVQRAVADAGFSLAYSTDPGLNGVGTDPLALRRVSAKAWDTRLAIVWKAFTGRPLPAAWERWLVLRHVCLQRATALARLGR